MPGSSFSLLDPLPSGTPYSSVPAMTPIGTPATAAAAGRFVQTSSEAKPPTESAWPLSVSHRMRPDHWQQSAVTASVLSYNRLEIALTIFHIQQIDVLICGYVYNTICLHYPNVGSLDPYSYLVATSHQTLALLIIYTLGTLNSQVVIKVVS